MTILMSIVINQDSCNMKLIKMTGKIRFTLRTTQLARNEWNSVHSLTAKRNAINLLRVSNDNQVPCEC